MTELSIAQINPLLRSSRAGKTREQYNAEIKAKQTHSCLHCKKEYLNKRRRLNEGIKFCSRECAFKHKKENAQPRFSTVFFNECVVCSSLSVSKKQPVLCCSNECRKVYNQAHYLEYITRKHRQTVATYKCKECEIAFVPEYGEKNRQFCTEKCCARYFRRFRRLSIKGVESETIDVTEIFKRDKWKCRCCGVKTPWTHRGSIKHTAPELDHIIPLSKGGTHTKANVQLLCRRCNGKKSNSHANDQMLLFG